MLLAKYKDILCRKITAKTRHLLLRLLSYRPTLFWNFWAIDFHKDQEQQRLHDWNVRALDLILAMRPKTILEVGCGFGRNLKELLNRGCLPGNLYGLDISQRMLKHADTFLAPVKIDLRIGSAAQLPYPNNSFDVVYLSLVLMHVPASELNACIREAVRVASKGIVVLDEYRQLPGDVKTSNINEYTFAHNHRELFANQGLKVEIFEVMEKWVVLSIPIGRKDS